jgi:transketolase
MLGARVHDVQEANRERPTLIVVDSHIGYGSLRTSKTRTQRTASLWAREEIRLTKKQLRLAGKREVPRAGRRPRALHGRHRQERAAICAKPGSRCSNVYKKDFPALADQLYKMQTRELPDGWDKDIPTFGPDAKGVAGRDASGKVLNAIAKQVPWLIGGSADLAPSTKTRLTFDGAGDFGHDNYGGRNFHFGIREHAMASIINGMALSKLRAYGSGFMIFSDYARGAIRLSSIMELPVTHIFTHDSIGVGEDGPTHQPIEQLPSLRAIPGLITLRPGDANEVAEAWRIIMKQKHEPVALILSRQAMPTLDRTKYAAASGLRNGAYVLADAPGGKPEVILMASGSEVSLVVAAHEALCASGVRSRVVSFPCWELFERQTPEYKQSVLPHDVLARVAVEQASPFGWERYVGLTGRAIGMTSFGASAPLSQLQKKFGFTVDAIVAAAKAQLAGEPATAHRT